MTFRTRCAVALLSFVVIGLELVLMRVLSMRFWYYFASMVISVGLLGFGCSGTVLALARNLAASHRRSLLPLLAFATSMGVFLSAWGVQAVPLDVHYLAWNPRAEWVHILEIELLILLPFLPAGGFLGMVLMDRPERIHGHYAANLIGSGAGALVSLILMSFFSLSGLLTFLAFLCYCAGLFLIPWRSSRGIAGGIGFGVLFVVVAWLYPAETRISPYKKLAMEKSKPRTRILFSAHGPQGRIDVVQGPAVHDAPPGMSLNNPHPIPERCLVIVDGDQTFPVYDAESLDDWRFLDYTTTALPFHLGKADRVLIVGPGGGAPVALARMHGAGDIVALAGNPGIVELLKGRLARNGGDIFNLPQLRVHSETPRGFLRRTGERYDLILLPLLDAAGGGGGLQAAQEDYLHTVESFRSFLRHLKDGGILCVSVHARTPPRDGLRIFNTAVEALSREGLPPKNRSVLIRSWETVTLLAQRRAWTPEQGRAVRDFSVSRGFDLCYLPDMRPEEANRFHRLPDPHYYRGARTLLGPNREQYVDAYLFALDPPTDDRPYFNNYIRWDRLAELKDQLKGRLPAFLELGSLMLAAALFQVLLLALVLIFAPLLPKASGLRNTPKKGSVLAYFFLLGLGFMLLEMGFLQKMILYLAHPIYSASAVMASFLVFAGLGSRLSARWDASRSRDARLAALAVGLTGLFYLVLLDPWLSLSQGLPLPVRFLVAAMTICPLALAMGHLFPLGLRRIGRVPALVPWSWAVNGFASVLATASTPLLAMSMGFSRVILAAIGCYLAAGALFSFLPKRDAR